MRRASRLASFLVASAALAGVSAVQKVTRQGRYLYNADGSRFYIKGVAYQPQGTVNPDDPNNAFGEPDSFIDALANSTGCSRDLPFLQQLEVNTIRAYSVNSSLNHDDCMNALSQAGIYTIIDLSLPVNGSIDRDSPAWTTNLLDLYINTIDTFSKYDNVLAYNVGNEVITTANATAAAAFIKAAARDVKAYLASKSSSALVGYAAIDADDSWLVPFANYLSCDPSGSNNGDTALDLFGLNNYEWCGDSQPSVYNDKNGAFAGYNVAAYFSEYGNVQCPPRLWTEVGTLFSEPMTDIWSGGIAFSYFPAQSAAGQFGMVNISSDGTTVTTGDDFNRLKTQYGQTTPPNSPSASGSTTFPACPTQNSTFLASTTLPPTPNDAGCNCLNSAFACRFTPTVADPSSIIGVLINQACGDLGGAGGSCDAIAANGSSGVYGAVSFCDASTKLSYVMDAFYEATNSNAQSCDFAGNATVNSQAPSNSAAVASAISACLAAVPSTFTPSAPASTSGGAAATGSSGSGSGSGTGSGNADSGALAFGAPAVVGVLVSAVFSVLGGLLVLA